MKINFAKEFTKQYRKVDPKIKKAVEKRLQLFMKDPFNSILSNHPLTGDYHGYRSINITGDWRAIYSESEDNTNQTVLTFKSLGSHSMLYR